MISKLLQNPEGEPFALDETVRELRRSAKRGEPSGSHVRERFSRLFAAPDPTSPIRLVPSDGGETLLEKLLVERARALYVPASSPWPEDDVDLVHDLRVAARRLRESLAIGRPLIRPRAARRTDQRIRKLARALGERRTLDVVVRDLRAHVEQGVVPASPDLLEFLEQRRSASTHAIRRRFPPAKLVAHGLGVLAIVLEPGCGSTSLADVARGVLEARADRVEPLLASIDDARAVSSHHELRIALKHLRYALEILFEAYPDEIDVERTISPLRVLQDALGELNDAKELLAIAREHRPTVEGSIAASTPASNVITGLVRAADAKFGFTRRIVSENAPRVIAATRAAAASIERA